MQAKDPAQLWAFDTSGNHSALVDQARGLCAGCGGGPMSGCGGTARTSGNASGYGLGMQACLLGHSGNGVAGAPDPRMEALGTGDQLFNISENGTIRVRGGKGAAGSCLGQASGGGNQVVQGFGPYQFCDQGWTAKPHDSLKDDAGAGTFSVVSLELIASPGMCLSSAGEKLEPAADPWCECRRYIIMAMCHRIILLSFAQTCFVTTGAENNNMWRSNTDVLQCWPRTMVEAESVSTQGTISKPGAWSFPDCLELGVPGYGSYTWCVNPFF